MNKQTDYVKFALIGAGVIVALYTINKTANSVGTAETDVGTGLGFAAVLGALGATAETWWPVIFLA